MSKTIPPSCPEPETGRTYWRSLDQLSDTPEFREWLHREFPSGASELVDPVSRRHFVKIMSASFALAGMGLGLTGCRKPEEKVEPFGKQPEGYVHGVPSFYATAMPTRTGALPLVAKSHDGRPVKVEGNSLYPNGNGGTDRFAQASILNLYDPDRATRYLQGGFDTTKEKACDFLGELSTKFSKNQGAGLAFLVEPGNSPSRQRMREVVKGVMAKAGWFTHDPTGAGVHAAAASEFFGQDVAPTFNFDKAEVIVSLDCDFLGSEEEVHNNIRRFADGRRLTEAKDAKMSRLYAIEGLLTLTGANADHRLRLQSSAVLGAAKALAAAAGVSGISAEGVPAEAAKWLAECANDLKEAGDKALVVAGVGQPAAVHALAYAINAKLGSIGRTVEFRPAQTTGGTLQQLATALNGDAVDTLIILGGNPAYTAPADLNWAAAQKKAKTVVRLGYHEDETAEGCTWHIPAVHYLETWGDARTSDGTVVPIQPLIAPLFNGMSDIEILSRLVGAGAVSSYEIVRETFSTLVSGDIEAAWRKFLHDGFLPKSAAKAVSVSLSSSAVAKAVASATSAAAGKLEVVFRRDYKLDDGSYNNNGWMLELPDPITKVTWDNVISVSRKTAHELGLVNDDVVTLTVGGRSVEGTIYVQPGQVDGTLGVTLGWGRTKTGRVGKATGFNAYAIRSSDAPFIAVGATVTKTGKKNPLSCTQEHWSMEGRPIIREANLEQFKTHPDFTKSLNLHEPPKPKGEEGVWPKPLYDNPFDKAKQSALHQWGMSVDLNACVGCSACVLACQSENNIPIVGKDQVRKGREMHWLRLDRYYTTDKLKFRAKPDMPVLEAKQQFESWIDDVQVITQPMMCQHCESAPCESVCPVNATAHDSEGLNVMAYNRCVGTRYCSNNCPYKVRRFNFFDYNKRPIDALYMGPLGKRKDDEWDLLKMAKNPEVTVRMRGVMEKCTFCLQRIESAKIAQKVKAGASGDVVVPTDSFTTACAQACPAGAIVFGNIADENSRVAKLKKQSRDYSVLEFLLTKPRLTYLARVRNPNPKMPDYYESPLSLQEYEVKMGNPFEQHGAGHGAAHETVPTGHAVEPKGAH